MFLNGRLNLAYFYFLYWKNEHGVEDVFEGIIVIEKKVKMVRIVSPFYKDFYFVKGNYDKYKENQDVKVKLKFFLEGVRAEIV